jgi:hypothetical protein
LGDNKQRMHTWAAANSVGDGDSVGNVSNVSNDDKDNLSK